MNGTGIFLCNFSGMIKNVLPSLRQGPARQGTAADKKHPQRHCRWLLLASPAHAGKSTGRTPKQCVFKDHPRVCGEKFYLRSAVFGPQGSPPRVRGKETEKSDCDDKRRITPACAGKRYAVPLYPPPLKDHPRVCGEKPDRILWEHWKEGSPPRVRGKVLNSEEFVDHYRITPACAGKSIKF